MFQQDFSVHEFEEFLPGFFNIDEIRNECIESENNNFQPGDDSMDNESICSAHDYPKFISDWNAHHIMQWILGRYEKKKYCFEDLNLHHIRKLNGADLSYLTEADWKQIDEKRSKWLYKRIQGVIRTLNKNAFCNNLQQRDESIDNDSVSSAHKLNNKFPKFICEWKDRHIMKWILRKYEKKKYCFEDLNLHLIRKLKGSCLRDFTEADWKQIDQNRSKWLYKKVQKLVQTLDKNLSENVPCIQNEPSKSNNDIIQEFPKKSRGRPRKQPKRKPERRTVTLAQAKPKNSEEAVNQIPLKRKRGRPRIENPKRSPPQKNGLVWEFLRDLLLNPKYCPSIICWEDYSTKKFRLLDAPEVARLWAQKRNKPNMTYRYFSRTIRHYYKHEIILSDPERFVYKFGINAKGIETDNPNFRNGIPNRT